MWFSLILSILTSSVFSPPTLTVSHPRCLSVSRSSAQPPFGCLSPLFSPSNYLSVFPIINFQEQCCSKLELWSKRPQLSDLSYYKLTGTRGNFPSGSAEGRFSCSEPGIVEDPDLQGTRVQASALNHEHRSLDYDCNKYQSLLPDKPRSSVIMRWWAFAEVLGFCCGPFVLQSNPFFFSRIIHSAFLHHPHPRVPLFFLLKSVISTSLNEIM